MPDDADKAKTAKCLLSEVEKEIQTFEAKKLGQFKGELDALLKKQEGLLAEYRRKYPLLCERWRLQHQDIERLHCALSCAVPNRKEIISDRLCKKKDKIRRLEERWQSQRKGGSGPLECARNDAAAKLDKCKARLDALNGLVQRIEAVLNDGDKIIKEIQGLLPGPQTAVAVYLLWFKLLPSHMGLRPETDAGKAAEKFAAGERPEDWCPLPPPDPCMDKEHAVDPDRKEQPKGFGRCDAWLMPPPDYAGKLDQAWRIYRQAKDDFADKDATYRMEPDDTASLDERIKALKKSFDERVRHDLAKALQPQNAVAQGDCAPNT